MLSIRITFGLKVSFAISIFLVAAISYFFIARHTSLQKQLPMQVIVRIPDNTPADDKIFFFSNLDRTGRLMQTNGPQTYTIHISPQEFGLEPNAEIRYRYTRNQINLAQAEYITGIPNADNDFFFGAGEYANSGFGRTLRFQPGLTQNDTIERWRWFPDSAQPNDDITALLPTLPFLPRVNSTRFQSSQGIWDLYRPDFDDFNPPTAARLKERGFEWVILYPPWQWLEQSPLPKAGNSLEFGLTTHPNYTDEQLIKQIQAFKQAGLKVIVAPQLENADIRDRSFVWWETYWSEIERLYLHYGQLAEQAQADSFLVDFPLAGLSQSFSSDIISLEQQSWQKIFSRLQTTFSKDIGQFISIWDTGIGLAPEVKFITWTHDIDLFFVFTNAVLSNKLDPSQSDLVAAAGDLIDQTSVLYETYHKPVIMTLGTHPIKNSWQDTYSYPLGRCGEETSDTDCSYEFSALDQARTIHAFFEAIRTRPWVIGLSQFGYGLWDMPLIREWDIRGKTAERIWEQWNEFIYGSNNQG